MYTVYIIQSMTTSKTYVGYTSDLKRRLLGHNGAFGISSKHTKRNSGPWKLIYKEEYSTKTEAIIREKFFKSGQGREWRKNNIQIQNA
ncbi:MAG: hypothetical protein A2231_06325 [Candidatus Firestonebacteria bacterium RIFOXYA2_FULL_40_8]|nr:MAG: hypothetical protein A2231_06325 [Candidatus Firestonebacteria bacterium RIFOXYA2_FULL_40_8]